MSCRSIWSCVMIVLLLLLLQKNERERRLKTWKTKPRLVYKLHYPKAFFLGMPNGWVTHQSHQSHRQRRPQRPDDDFKEEEAQNPYTDRRRTDETAFKAVFCREERTRSSSSSSSRFLWYFSNLLLLFLVVVVVVVVVESRDAVCNRLDFGIFKTLGALRIYRPRLLQACRLLPTNSVVLFDDGPHEFFFHG